VLVSRPRRFTSGAHWLGVWVVPSADLDAVAKRKIPNPDGPARTLV